MRLAYLIAYLTIFTGCSSSNVSLAHDVIFCGERIPVVSQVPVQGDYGN